MSKLSSRLKKLLLMQLEFIQSMGGSSIQDPKYSVQWTLVKVDTVILDPFILVDRLSILMGLSYVITHKSLKGMGKFCKNLAQK